jgi:UDP-N-acetylmuramyl pentapeptide phosphotransferase/UDP-N-acetylglucosamine-1-phosphate transferase
MDQTTIARPRKRFQMPLLLTIGMALSAFCAITYGLALLVFALVIPFSHTFTINDAPATRSEFLKFAAPILGGSAVVGVIAGLAAYALWHERPRSRELMMAMWGLVVVIGIGVLVWGETPSAEAIAGLVEVVIIAAVAYWYLYHKRSVVAYYRTISEQQGQRDSNSDLSGRGA